LCADLKTPVQFTDLSRLPRPDKDLKTQKFTYKNQQINDMSHFNDKPSFKPRRLSGKAQKKLSPFHDRRRIHFRNLV